MEPYIPQLTTPQTEIIRSSYPNIEHLEAGNIAIWLQERRDQLWQQAKDIETSSDTAKVINLGVAAVSSVMLATSPFAPIAATLAGIGYIWTVVQDYHQTKQFIPLPLVRGNFFDFLSSMGDADERSSYSVNHELETMKFLNRDEQIEYAMLHGHFEFIVHSLGQVLAGKRFHAYRWITQAFNRFRAMPQQAAINNYLESVNPDTRVNYQQVKAIAQQQSQYQCIELPHPVQSNWQDNAPSNFSASLSPAYQESEIETYTPSSSVDIVGELINDGISNSLILGLPGSGKGMLLANAIRAAKAKYSDLNIFVIDPKASDKEVGYFQGIANVVKRCKCEDLEPKDAVEWIKECFDEYNRYVAQHGRTLLILDEGTLVGNKAKKAKDTILQDKLVSLTSCGDVEGKNVWIAAQAPFVGGLGIDLSISSQLLVIALIQKKNVGSVLQQWKRSAMLEGVPLDLINKLIESSPCDRAVYLGKTGKWYSMPSLQNYSGYDRDNRVMIASASTSNDALNSTERESLRLAQATKLRTSQDMIELLDATVETTIEGFIINVLRQEQRMSELKPAIIKAIEQCDRADLLAKFGIQN